MNFESIDNFFNRVEDVIEQQLFPIESHQLNLFKSLCIFDYMAGPCDWDPYTEEQLSMLRLGVDGQSILGEGKEEYAHYLLKNILDPTYTNAFFCEECDDSGSENMCEHQKQNHIERLEEFMKVCEENAKSQSPEKYVFHLPIVMSFGEWTGEKKIDTNKLKERDLSSQYFLSRTKELFEHREMDYNLFLRRISSGYSDDVLNLV